MSNLSLARLVNSSASVNTILGKKYNLTLNLSHFDEFLENIAECSDMDIDTINDIMKASIYWVDYFNDYKAALMVYYDMYVNVRDVYEYIEKQKKLTEEEMIVLLKKYKVYNKDDADIWRCFFQKKNELNENIQQMKKLISSLESYVKYITSVYYKTNQLSRKIEQREKRA